LGESAERVAYTFVAGENINGKLHNDNSDSPCHHKSVMKIVDNPRVVLASSTQIMTHQSEGENWFIIDSGCSDHMVQAKLPALLKTTLEVRIDVSPLPPSDAIRKQKNLL